MTAQRISTHHAVYVSRNNGCSALRTLGKNPSSSPDPASIDGQLCGGLISVAGMVHINATIMGNRQVNFIVYVAHGRMDCIMIRANHSY